MKSKELAQRLYVSDSLIRHWSGEFSDFLSNGAAPEKPGTAREFTENDQLVMASVSALRGEGDSYDEIRAKLRNGWRLEEVPPPPEHELTRTGDEPPVTPERFRAALRRLADKDEQIAQLEAQLRQERSGRETLYERLLSETEARARLEGEIKVLREHNGRGPRWPWQRGEK